MAADSPPGDARVFGLKPWYPWPLSRWRWLNEPVRAERLAALRIGLALVMLLDVFFTYCGASADLFGPDSLGEPRVFNYRYFDSKTMEQGGPRWSLLRDDNPRDVEAAKGRIKLLMGLWVMASFLMLIGCGSRLSAIYCWAISVSAAVSNSYIDNAGDSVRTLTLFYVMLTPSGAAWSVEAWLRRRFHWTAVRGSEGEFRGLALVRRDEPLKTAYYVYPWALRLLFVQMMFIYLFNGLYKASGDTWHEGSSLYYVLGDLTMARVSYAWLTLPYEMTQVMTRMVLWWEVLFAPVMMVPWRGLANLVERIPYVGGLDVLVRWNREVFLIFGAMFHIGIWVAMELGGFAPYMLSLYLPFIPWERLASGVSHDPGKSE